MGEQIRKALWVVALGAIFLWANFPAVSGATSTPDLFKELKERLVRDGFDKAAIDKLYAEPGVNFEVDAVSLFFIHNEASLDYGQFSKPEPVKRARAYMKRHKAVLDKAQTAYGVDKEVITAILLVETQLGKYVGRSVVINTLSTMAALSDAKARDTLYRKMPKEKRMDSRDYEKKARAKAGWAYKELKALIEHADAQGMDPVAIKGSYAGAMGLAQFLPSNAIKLGVDGNGNGRVDLFEDDDAIFSIAYYLKYHGWKKGISKSKAHRVIRHYNNSTYYADAVLAVADQLRK
ncbi:MAG: lytic murein transglycosylase [Pseudomonadota bacterium]